MVTGGFPLQKAGNAELWCLFVISVDKLVHK